MNYLISTILLTFLFLTLAICMIRKMEKHLINLFELSTQKKVEVKRNMCGCKHCGCLLFPDEIQCPDCGYLNER